MRPVLFIPLFVLLSFPLLGRETREQALERKRALRRTTHVRDQPRLSAEERFRLQMAKRLKDMDGTAPNRFEQEWAMHMNRPQGRAGSLAPSALGPSGVMTSGDIVVMEDDGSMVSEVPEFDLAGQGIRFVPNAQGGYVTSIIAPNFDSDLGTPLLLDFGQNPGEVIKLDGSSRVLFPQGFTFKYYGRAYSEIFVNANGNITFEQPDPTFAVSFITFNTPFPRIAPLFDDFDPGAGGGVFSKQLIDRLVITWNEVPEFFTNNSTSFQAVLFRSGEIEFHYNGVEALLGKIGLTPGVQSSQEDLSAISATITIPGVDAIFDLFPTGFDLTPRSLTFIPAPGGGFQVAPGASAIETNFTAEERLDLLDDDSKRIFFEGDFVFPLSGRSIQSFWVNSNGSVTIDFPDFFLPFFGDPLALQLTLLGFGPRIAPLMADLDPEAGGQIYWRQLPDRVIVAWIDVVEFDSELPNTFQLTAFSNGVMRLDYGTINLTSAAAGVVGDVPLEKADWSAGRPSQFIAGVCEFFGSKPFDLNGRRITFTPNGSGHDVEVGMSSFEGDLGAAIEFPTDGDDDDDDATELFFDAGFTFPFFGASWSSLFVSTNGHLTFNSPDPRSMGAVGSFFSDQPRIVGFGHDLNPTNQGGVFFRQLADRAIFTWLNIPDFLFDVFGLPDSNTFQVTLFNTGVITVDFIAIDQFEGLTGIAPGGSDVPFNLVDMDLEAPLTNVAGIVGESFSFLRQVDIFRLTQKFFETHDDIFDFVILFSDFNYDLGGALAFHIGVNNQVTGTGQDEFDRSEFFGSGPGLRSFVNMNSLLVYPDDPHALLAPGVDDNSYLSVMGQEAGHSWLAFVDVSHPQLESTALLGRSLGHWSFFMNSDASVMEGNKWVETTPGNFTAIETVARFSRLDQYMMGLRSPSEVPNFFVIANPMTDVFLPSSPPRRGTTLSGERVDVTIQNVIAANGPRSPAFPDAPRSFRGAFILLVRNGMAPSAENLAKLETFRAAWVSFFAQTTGARGQFFTGLTIPNAVDPATWSRLE